MTDCTPVYTVIRFAKDILAAIGIAAICGALVYAGAWVLARLIDGAAVDL